MIISRADRELYLRAFEKWGKTPQMVVAIEEMSELTKLLCKDVRNWFRNIPEYNRMAEEIADVHIMLEQLIVLYGIRQELFDFEQKVAEERQKKLKKLGRMVGKKR